MTDTNKTIAERVASLSQLSPTLLATLAVEANDLLIVERNETAQLRKTLDWWKNRNAELHDEIGKGNNVERNLRESMRTWANEKAEYIREVARLKRELEELHAKRGALLRVAGAQAVEIASLKVALEDANLPTPPCDDEWDSWNDAAVNALKESIRK